MKYYVVTDVHGFYTEMKAALEEQGYFSDTQPHKLIICGDLLDRGSEPKQMQDFVCGLLPDDVIPIRGNHEDLLDSMLSQWLRESYFMSHHVHNGTTTSVLMLTNHSAEDLNFRSADVYRDIAKTPFVREILPQTVDYFETKNYIFVHGWIPCATIPQGNGQAYVYNRDWRNASDEEWKKARWYNGMDAAFQGATEEGKTIVCGHWHCSYGHSKYEGKGDEFGATADFSPYVAKGIICLDACTALSHKVNCLVIEDDPID